MKTRTSRLFRLSALAAGLCLAQAALAADPGAAPSYQALPAGNLPGRRRRLALQHQVPGLLHPPGAGPG